MSEDNSKRPIIIKRIKKVSGGHHGGSWKIAYADFVTAMMAFFLLMWLLSMMNKYQLQGISDYFKTPLKEIFNKQDNVAPKTKVNKPDSRGPDAYKETGFKEKTLNPPQSTQGQPQNPVKNGSAFQYKNEADAAKEAAKQTQQLKQLEAVKADLEKKIEGDPQISQFKNQLNFVITADGLKIIINDLKDKPMFSLGKTDFQKYADTILGWLSTQINAYPNKVMIIGHTDNLQYPPSATYSNWELSADRANATRRSLIKNGVATDKILRIVGGADTNQIENRNASDPANRRIEIIMLTDQAAKHIQNL